MELHLHTYIHVEWALCVQNFNIDSSSCSSFAHTHTQTHSRTHLLTHTMAI